jgi:hypothetical protein
LYFASLIQAPVATVDGTGIVLSSGIGEGLPFGFAPE